MFLRLKLEDENGKLLGCNTYWHNRVEYQNYRALNAAITLAKNGMTLTPKTSLADASAESLFSQLLRLGADEGSAQRHLTGLGYTQQTASALAADYAAWQKAQVKA